MTKVIDMYEVSGMKKCNRREILMFLYNLGLYSCAKRKYSEEIQNFVYGDYDIWIRCRYELVTVNVYDKSNVEVLVIVMRPESCIMNDDGGVYYDLLMGSVFENEDIMHRFGDVVGDEL